MGRVGRVYQTYASDIARASDCLLFPNSQEEGLAILKAVANHNDFSSSEMIRDAASLVRGVIETLPEEGSDGVRERIEEIAKNLDIQAKLQSFLSGGVINVPFG